MRVRVFTCGCAEALKASSLEAAQSMFDTPAESAHEPEEEGRGLKVLHTLVADLAADVSVAGQQWPRCAFHLWVCAGRGDQATAASLYPPFAGVPWVWGAALLCASAACRLWPLCCC